MKLIVIVIQPLISLMKDQIIGLNPKGIKVSRLMLSSGNDFQKGVQQKVKDISIVLASPKAVLDIHRSIFQQEDLKGRIVCVAVDKEHCIVKW